MSVVFSVFGEFCVSVKFLVTHVSTVFPVFGEFRVSVEFACLLCLLCLVNTETHYTSQDFI